MSAKERTTSQLQNLAHKHTTTWYTGDGAKTEFALPTQVLRADDVVVYVNGVIMRPRDRATANDYAVRGFFPSFYPGDKNRVKFTAAPAAVNIALIVAGG